MTGSPDLVMARTLAGGLPERDATHVRAGRGLADENVLLILDHGDEVDVARSPGVVEPRPGVSLDRDRFIHDIHDVRAGLSKFPPGSIALFVASKPPFFQPPGFSSSVAMRGLTLAGSGTARQSGRLTVTEPWY